MFSKIRNQHSSQLRVAKSVFQEQMFRTKQNPILGNLKDTTLQQHVRNRSASQGDSLLLGLHQCRISQKTENIVIFQAWTSGISGYDLLGRKQKNDAKKLFCCVDLVWIMCWSHFIELTLYFHVGFFIHFFDEHGTFQQRHQHGPIVQLQTNSSS